MPRKTTAALLCLPEEQQLELYELLKGGMTYRSAVQYCRVEYGLKTNLASLHDAWETWAKQAERDRVLRNVAAAQAIHSEAAASLGTLDAATDAALHQAAFEALQADDPEAVKTYLTMILQRQKADLDAEKLELENAKFEEAKRKAALADQAKEIAEDDNKSPEEVRAGLKALFGR